VTIRRKYAEIDADRIEFLLSKKYAAPMYAFMPQLRNGTGYRSTVRTADAIAFSLWPSRGLYLHGFEIKVNRGDWLNEMRNPAKAEEHAQFCQYWSLVIAEGIADPMEVPLGWGLIVASKDGELTEVRKAPSREPAPLSTAFIAAMFRNVNESIAFLKPSYVHVEDIEARITEEAERLIAKRRDVNESAALQLKDLQETVREFEKASGVTLARYGNERIGSAVEAVLRIGADQILLNLQASIDRAQQSIDVCRAEVATARNETRAGKAVA
jgi:hypothetical protein